MNEEVKICKNCKWYKSFWLDQSLSKCRNPKASVYGVDPVTGDTNFAFCSVERQNYRPLVNCGPEGRYYEPKN